MSADSEDLRNVRRGRLVKLRCISTDHCRDAAETKQTNFRLKNTEAVDIRIGARAHLELEADCLGSSGRTG